MGGSLLTLLRESRSKFGGAYGCWFQLMPQFQPQVPDPLGDQLPALLSPGRVTTPSIGVDFLVFIRESPYTKKERI